jgi:hypothetical protein
MCHWHHFTCEIEYWVIMVWKLDKVEWKNYGLFHGNKIGEGISQNGDTILKF